MLKSQSPKLSIFETFKTKREQLTGEAIRQRHIISHLAREDSSTLTTRTAIAQNIAKKNNLLWKNIYSGVFRDLDEILIPLDIVFEAGRLPLKRDLRPCRRVVFHTTNLQLKDFLWSYRLMILTKKILFWTSFYQRLK